MQIEGKGRVFAKEYEGWTAYSIGIYTKDKEGKYVNGYQPIRLRKGESLPNGSYINFKAFPTVVKGKERNMVIWQITEYTVDGEVSVPAENEFTALTNDDIPF